MDTQKKSIFRPLLKKKVGFTGRPKSNFLLDYNLTYSHENSNAKGNYRKWECNVSFQVDLGSKNLDYFHFRWFNIMSFVGVSVT